MRTDALGGPRQTNTDGYYMGTGSNGGLLQSTDFADDLDVVGLDANSFVLCAGRKKNNVCNTYTLSNYEGKGMTASNTRTLNAGGNGLDSVNSLSYHLKIAKHQGGANFIVCYVTRVGELEPLNVFYYPTKGKPTCHMLTAATASPPQEVCRRL
jgi:hypothetical protein